MKGFQIAGGSVPGTDHTKPGQPGWSNSQDTFDFYSGRDYLIAVVSDGCGSTPHAEVGSKIIARLVINWFVYWLDQGAQIDVEHIEAFLKNGLGKDIQRQIESIASLMWQDHKQIVENYFLATIVAVVMTKAAYVDILFGVAFADHRFAFVECERIVISPQPAVFAEHEKGIVVLRPG